MVEVAAYVCGSVCIYGYNYIKLYKHTCIQLRVYINNYDYQENLTYLIKEASDKNFLCSSRVVPFLSVYRNKHYSINECFQERQTTCQVTTVVNTFHTLTATGVGPVPSPRMSIAVP